MESLIASSFRRDKYQDSTNISRRPLPFTTLHSLLISHVTVLCITSTIRSSLLQYAVKNTFYYAFPLTASFLITYTILVSALLRAFRKIAESDY